MKIVRRGALPRRRRRRHREGARPRAGGHVPHAHGRGERGTRDVLAGLRRAACLGFVDVAAIAPLKVVLDGANGMAGHDDGADPRRACRSSAERCHFEPDGDVPALPAEPAAGGEPPLHRRRGARRRRRPRHRLGRRRRPLLLHRRHGRVRARATSSPRSWPSRCSPSDARRDDPLRPARLARGAPTSSRRAGGKAIASRVGHAFIKHRMRKERRALRGRGLGPLLLPRLLRRGHRHRARARRARARLALGRRLSELLAPLRERYHLSGEINSTVADVPLKLQELKERYGPGGEGGASRTSTASRSTSTTGTSTCGRPTPSRCCASTSRRTPPTEMERRRDEVLGPDPLVSAPAPPARPSAAAVPLLGARCAWASTRPTPRRSSTTAATSRTSTARASSTSATSAAALAPGRARVRDAAHAVRVRGARALRRRARGVHPHLRRSAARSWRQEFAVHHCESGELLAARRAGRWC